MTQRLFKIGTLVHQKSAFSPITLSTKLNVTQTQNPYRTFSLSRALLNEQEDATSALEEKTPKSREVRKEAKIGAVRTDGRTNRWYKKVGVDKFHQAGEDGFVVTLDGRVIKTPKENHLFIPTASLALSIASEWDSQSEKVKPLSMPLMTLSATAIDVIPEKRKIIIDSLMSHLNTDVVCVRSPSAQVGRKQTELHDPLLKWFSDFYKVAPLVVTSGLSVGQHPEETKTKIQWALFHCDDWVLAGLDSLCTYTRSLVISLAVWNNRISLEQAIKAARIEEDFQIERFGEVKGSHDLDIVDQRVKIAAATLFLHLLPEKSKKL